MLLDIIRSTFGQLVLSRKRNEEVVISIPPSERWQQCYVNVVDIRSDKVRLAFSADPEIKIHRTEVLERIANERIAKTA